MNIKKEEVFIYYCDFRTYNSMEIRNISDNCIRANSYGIQWLCFQKYKPRTNKTYIAILVPDGSSCITWPKSDSWEILQLSPIIVSPW
jgi:hypothetical protein